MKPKAKRFRIRQAVAAEIDPPRPPSDLPSTDDGLGGSTFPDRSKSGDDGVKPLAAQLDDIRHEGLTGRQLRMARRVAHKQGLAATSDYDAVRLLREAGIDPFKRSNMLELVPSDTEGPDTRGPDKQDPDKQRSGSEDATEAKPVAAAKAQGTTAPPSSQSLPAAVAVQQLPSTIVNEVERSAGIMKIQRDIARRRRKRAIYLAMRLAAFVLLPTFIAGYYFYSVATPMYATKSEFVIQQAEPSGGGTLGGLFSGTGFATSQDSIAVQAYLQSLGAMIRLNEDVGFKQHFSQDHIDVLQRIEAESSNAEAYKLYKKHVRIGYDPTEGLLRMEVIAADPEASATFSEKLISYAEEQVDNLTARLRGDQMSGAEQSRREANDKMVAAQQRVVELQERLGVISPESEVQAVFGQISQLESELLAERLTLQTILGNRRPNEARRSAAANKIAELETLIAEKRAELTQSGERSGSLARISGELLVAQQDLETRQGLLAQAEAQFESARLEANRQVRYLSVGVNPVAPDEPTYPRVFENTMLAFLIFSGIYLMLSLTASILREQV